MVNSDDPNDFTEGALNFMKRAAPERAVALQKIFDDHDIRIRHTSRKKFEQGEEIDPSPSALMNTILYPPIMHTLAWLLTHGGWEAMRDYGSALTSFQLSGQPFSGSQVKAALNSPPKTKRCDEIIQCANDLVRGLETALPNWLPNIQETSPTSETNSEHAAIQELWLIAQCWFFFHELQHILFSKKDRAICEHREEELACDCNATSWLLDGVEFYSSTIANEPSDLVRGKRAMGILVGLFCIGQLSAPGGSASHPALQERVAVLLEQVADKKAGRFWYFAVGLLFVLSKQQDTI